MTKPNYRTHRHVRVIEDKDCPNTLGDLLEWVKASILCYGEEAEVNLTTPRWDNEGHVIEVYSWVPKTKEELDLEAKREAFRTKAEEARERALLEQLKKKYD